MVYIRVDMNRQIATGHVMRCLSIADAVCYLGGHVTFIVADEQAEVLLRQHGYDVIVLHTEWNHMETEIPVLSQVIKIKQIDTILIDSYQVTERYLVQLSRLVKTIYIDDLNKFDYPVSAVICYANYWKKFSCQAEKTEKKYYFGMQYVPLRQDFWNCRKKVISKRVEKILILTGGSDPYNVSGQILNSIHTETFKNIDVICGVYNTNYNFLVKEYGKNTNIQFHQAVNNIEEYMYNADVAISAGGTTLYELCASGTPTISYAFADNQLDNVRQFEEDGLINYAGDARAEGMDVKINWYLEKYQNDFQLRKNRSESMQTMVDGKGAIRLAEILINF